ncbi:SgrR family transcriptional regulator [Vibrio campbellii]|uniref:SgrR family transcriptional regulator n=1 Tax=Vibrio campbellii TaxID=680 RepID=UPI000CF37CC7|nr:SgrR family transcriptional regulator [Vibrio campbellii]
MNKRKLELYEDLFKKVGPGKTHIHIGEIADAFHCSDRHARTLLKQMGEYKWLTWTPMKGRGQKGELVCLQEPVTACYQAVDHAIGQERYDLAHQLVGFHDRSVASNLKRYLAHTAHNSENTIYAPFHRKLDWLHPHFAMGRTERHLIHEVFQTLVSHDGSAIHPNLAHHWSSSHSHTCWRFHLSSSAMFHDKTNVTAEDVVTSLNALVNSYYWRGLYDHIDAISAVTPYCVEINLSEPDPLLPSLLSRAETSILPSRFVHSEKLAFQPIGSGPFSVDINSDKVLRLNRNEHYCGQTALTKHIEIWIHEEWKQDKKCAENFFFLESGEENYQVSTQNIGHFYVLINHKELQTDSIKQGFSTLMSRDEKCSLALPFPISFSYEDNNESRQFSAKLQAALPSSSGQNKSHQVEYGRAISNQDITLGGIRLEGDQSTSLFAFFKLYPYWQQCMTWRQHSRLEEVLNLARYASCSEEREALLNTLLHELAEQNILSILATEDLTLTIPSRVAGVEINTIGWCNFSKLWIQPN